MLKNIYKLLCRDTQSVTYIREIDGFRFIAILVVVLFHANVYVLRHTGVSPDVNTLSLFLISGHYGVHLFFVISGFVISLPFANHFINNEKKIEYKDYYLRRLSRIEPPYFINIVFCFVLLTIFKGIGFAERAWPNLLGSLIYSHNIIFEGRSVVNAVAWSLEVELQFYVMAPLIVHVFRMKKYHRRFLLLLFISVVHASAYYFGGDSHIDSIVYYAGYFLAGFLMADIYIVDLIKENKDDIRFDFISTFLWLAMFFVLTFYHRVAEYFLPIIILSVYLSSLKSRFILRLFRLSQIYILGGMCYTIYLYHAQIISIIGTIVFPSILRLEFSYSYNYMIFCFLSMSAVLVVSPILFIYTEKVFMKRGWYKGLFRKEVA